MGFAPQGLSGKPADFDDAPENSAQLKAVQVLLYSPYSPGEPFPFRQQLAFCSMRYSLPWCSPIGGDCCSGEMLSNPSVVTDP